MKKKLLIIATIFVFGISVAQAETTARTLEVLQSFKTYFEVPQNDLIVPTVLELKLPTGVDNYYFGVYNITDDKFEPYAYAQEFDKNYSTPYERPISINTNSADSTDSNIGDGFYGTYKDFDLDVNGEGYAIIKYSFSKPIRANSIALSLDQFVSLPNSVTIKAIVNDVPKTVLSKSKPTGKNLTFPETIASSWEFEFYYSQPLRINELQINNLDFQKFPSVIRFLAQPGKEYQLYTNPDTIIKQQTDEKPNLNRDEDVIKIELVNEKDNLKFKLADTDGDGIADIHDNCVQISNTEQEDVNENGRGDSCDDFDKDGVLNYIDNCIGEPNRNQTDIDKDKIGDACDNEESRITEKYPWIVWGGIILAALVFLGLFAIALRKIRFNDTKIGDITSNPDDTTTNTPPNQI